MEQAVKLFSILGGIGEQISEGEETLNFSRPEIEPMRKRKAWTQFELDNVVQWYPNYSAKQVAKKLQRTRSAVNQAIFRMLKKGILKPKTKRPKKI